MTDSNRPKGSDVEAKLRNGELPQMVDWFDPMVLGHVGVRTVISSTIGQYADQRPMQAALDDNDPPAELARRHDYSDLKPKDRDPALKLDDQGRLWVDFVADLGDGFEATYAMAYLMAASSLTVKGLDAAEGPLPAGDMLIFGGDLAYPNATVKEYQDRCIAPYDLAFQTDQPQRKLFFIAGNHDWYDGLTAFTSVFCSARDRYSQGIGKRIGGWRCQQRRSYFAVKLPHDWWIWGYDVGLTDTVDDAQRDYFHIMSEHTKPGDNIILLTHAPDWLKPSYKSLVETMALARRNGADVATVLAGDLHHYSRYSCADTGLQLITAGGGGAFMHPTHQLDRRITVELPAPKNAPDSPSTTATASLVDVSARAAPEPVMAMIKPQRIKADTLYPSRSRSRMLAFRNLWLPFHNRRFAILMGVIYMVYAWAFQLAVMDPMEAIKKAEQQVADIRCVGVDGVPADQQKLCRQVFYEAIRNELNGFELRSNNAALKKLEEILVKDNLISEMGRKRLQTHRDEIAKNFVPTNEEFSPKPKVLTWSQTAKHYEGLIKKEASDSWRAAGYLMSNPTVLNAMISPRRILSGLLGNIVFIVMVGALWIGLVFYVDAAFKRWWVNGLLALSLGSLHFVAHMYLLLATNVFMYELVYSPWLLGTAGSGAILTGLALYSTLMVLIGGILGGMIFGLYWVLTSIIGNMHMESFSALGLKGYKNFLRMRFDPGGQLTIYAIGLDTVPGRRGWRASNSRDGAVRGDHNPALVPLEPLQPHLIEKIVINANPVARALALKPTVAAAREPVWT